MSEVIDTQLCCSLKSSSIKLTFIKKVNSINLQEKFQLRELQKLNIPEVQSLNRKVFFTTTVNTHYTAFTPPVFFNIDSFGPFHDRILLSSLSQTHMQQIKREQV